MFKNSCSLDDQGWLKILPRVENSRTCRGEIHLHVSSSAPHRPKEEKEEHEQLLQEMVI
jgi:hypothetical protein